MAALPNDAPVSASDRPRAGWVVAMVPPHVAALYAPMRTGVRDLPVPDCCRPYVREGEEGAAQYRCLVREAVTRVEGLGARLAEIAEQFGTDSEPFGRAVLDAIRTTRCPACGRRFGSVSVALYCSDACKRRASEQPRLRAVRRVRRFLRPDCAHCHAPLAAPETLFCSPACHKAAMRTALYTRRGEHRTTCVRCGAPLDNDQRRYCSDACHQLYQREWYAGLAVGA